MPKGGFYFDAISRQLPLDDDHLKVEDNLEEFVPISDEDLSYLGREAERLWTETDKAVVANFGGTAFGDIGQVPGTWLKHPKGIRDIEEWYISTVGRRDFVYKIFERQCEIGIKNLAKIHQVVGERVTAIMVSATDFGQQNGPFISPKAYRDLYQPFNRAVNDWVHKNTTWKTFIHSCGSVWALLEDFIAAGFDILNPVQCSATHMNPFDLKRNSETVSLFGEEAWTLNVLLPSAHRKRSARKFSNGSMPSVPGEASSLTPFTTFRRSSQWKTCWPCTEPHANTGAIRCAGTARYNWKL